MFPLRDSIYYHGSSLGTKGLISLCIIVFFLQISAGLEGFIAALNLYGFVPAYFFSAPMEEAWRIFTSMFMHGSLLHLIGNVWFLWVFAPAVEGKLGLKRFLLLYFLSGAGAALLQGLSDTASSIPMVGASGAISGILGAYFILFPGALVLTIVFPFFIFWVSAFLYLGYWALIQLLYGLAGVPGVAWWAHLGGFIIGAILVVIIKPKRNYEADPFYECWRGYC